MSKQLIEQLVKQHKVMIFTKSYCPHCNAVKELFNQLKQSFNSLELDKRDDGAAIQSALAEMTGQRTVPNVWINGVFKGGNSDIQALDKKGELKALLQ